MSTGHFVWCGRDLDGAFSTLCVGYLPRQKMWPGSWQDGGLCASQVDSQLFLSVCCPHCCSLMWVSAPLTVIWGYLSARVVYGVVSGRDPFSCTHTPVYILWDQTKPKPRTRGVKREGLIQHLSHIKCSSREKGFLGGSVVKIAPAMQETQVWSLGQEDPLEKEMATHSSILAWRILWTEEPSGL